LLSLQFYLTKNRAAYATAMVEERTAELRESEELFRNLSDQSPSAVFINSNGRIVYANRRSERITGYDRAELCSPEFDFRQLIAQESRDIAQAAFEKHMSGEDIAPYELSLVTKDKRQISTILATKLIDYGGEQAIMGVVTDITERKQAEKALQESESKLIEAQRIAKLGHYVFDIRTGYWTNSAELDGIFGIDASYEKDVAGWLQVVHPDWRKTMSDYIQDDIITQHNEFDKEYRIVDVKKGQEKWVHGLGSLKFDDYGNLVEMFGTVQDITERKLAETNSALLTMAIEQASETIVITDTEGTIQYVNPAFEEITGYTAEEAIGQNPRILKSGKQDDSFYERMWNTLLRGDTWRDQIINKKKDGTLFTEEISVSSIRDSEGKTTNYVAVKYDITEIMRLRNLEKRAQRLETAGTIAGQVAHDFNNLLAPLMAYPELIKEELPDNHRAQSQLNDIENCAVQIAEINQQLLALGRRGHYNMEPLNINRVVDQIVRELIPPSDTLSCTKILDENLMSILGGGAQLHRVLSNLVINALDATGEEGQITIRTENQYVDNMSIVYGRVPRGEYVKLTIADTGSGISDNDIQSIFDPFFTTKKASKKRGSGLGLSVVAAVLDDHDAFIDLSTKEGEGTSFYLYLPVCRENAIEQAPKSVSGGNESILIVDDDRMQREVMIRLLTKLGYQVSAVDCGNEAIEFLKESRQDLLILDMIMPPGIDGVETLRRVLDMNPSQRAIIVSGFAGTDRVKLALEMGAGAFVRKPLTSTTLAAAVRKELDREIPITA
jgi:PAS domain S-box-containing protein